MRSGFVHLNPGATVGWHTTGKNEEALVILRGQGEALIDGQAQADLRRASARLHSAHHPPQPGEHRRRAARICVCRRARAVAVDQSV